MTERLDAELAARGLARSRTHAGRLIASGSVRVGGSVVTKPSTRVHPEQHIAVDADRYVSRAAHKLLAALDAFRVDPSGRTALDLGASTGGFTQALRERGADPVLAVDVGHGQLAPEIAADPGVRVVEGMNARFLTRDALAEATGVTDPPSLVTGDLSFISLTHVIPAAAEVADARAEFLLLVKPQFEVGRERIRAGVVVDPELRAQAVRGVLGSAAAVGLGALGVIASPIAGTHGNQEYVIHLSRGLPGDDDEIERALGAIARG